MAYQKKAYLSPDQKRKLDMLKELHRRISIAIDEIQLDGTDFDEAIEHAQLQNYVNSHGRAA